MSKEIYKSDIDSDEESNQLTNNTENQSKRSEAFLAEPPKKLNGNALPMAIFRECSDQAQEPFPCKIPKQNAYGGYPTQHLEHVKEFI